MALQEFPQWKNQPVQTEIYGLHEATIDTAVHFPSACVAVVHPNCTGSVLVQRSLVEFNGIYFWCGNF